MDSILISASWVPEHDDSLWILFWLVPVEFINMMTRYGFYFD